MLRWETDSCQAPLTLRSAILIYIYIYIYIYTIGHKQVQTRQFFKELIIFKTKYISISEFTFEHYAIKTNIISHSLWQNSTELKQVSKRKYTLYMYE